MNYYVKVNFTSVMKMIAAIDGINVYSPKSFKSSISDYSYKRGWNKMGGKKALYFARERKAFAEGDMQRNKNQQKVLKAIFKKITTSETLLLNYTDILKCNTAHPSDRRNLFQAFQCSW